MAQMLRIRCWLVPMRPVTPLRMMPMCFIGGGGMLVGWIQRWSSICALGAGCVNTGPCILIGLCQGCERCGAVIKDAERRFLACFALFHCQTLQAWRYV